MFFPWTLHVSTLDVLETVGETLTSVIIKMTVLLPLCRRQGEEKVQLLTSALDGVSGQRHASSALNPGEESPVST
jgi:hypothetical protein